MPPLCLASASPRRRALLEQLGLSFIVDAADVDETARPGETAAGYVARVAGAKALAGAVRRPDHVVLAADTTVAIDGLLLGKPADDAEADAMLQRLSGRDHSVWTGVALGGAARGKLVVETRVTFRPLRSEERAWYVRSGEPRGKAGGYAIQGLGAVLIQAIAGSYTNVVGLPLAETALLLRDAGVPLPWSTA